MATVLTQTGKTQIARVKTGECLTVRIAETPTTGRRWRLEGRIPAILSLQGDEFQAPDSTQPGAGGIHQFTFCANTAGKAQLRFRQYFRGTLEEPGAEMIVDVEIRD